MLEGVFHLAKLKIITIIRQSSNCSSGAGRFC
jgi:hypothetical protein